jgi:hypothetical protein
MWHLAARTEIHDAWTNIAHAKALLAQGKYKEANDALLDAQGHYQCARSVTTIEQAGSIQDKLADLKIKLDQIRSTIKIKSGTLERHAGLNR